MKLADRWNELVGLLSQADLEDQVGPTHRAAFMLGARAVIDRAYASLEEIGAAGAPVTEGQALDRWAFGMDAIDDEINAYFDEIRAEVAS